MQELTLGSLFDGIGGFCYAAYLTGRIKPIWAAEIEQNCIDITRHRFPEVMHVGSVTELKGDEVQPVDIITFGSPCQDLSIAGQRKGLKGSRSGLFMEAIRIIEEMRLATNGKYPTFIIWENVPGAFSSGGGADFRAVLEKITKTSIPMPASGGWAAAGMVRGGEADTAWRVLDAQFWGVPQRRKRIYLVGDFGGQRAGEILFKPESLLRYTPKGKEQKQEAAGQFADGVGAKNSGAVGEATGLSFAHADSVARTFEGKAPALLRNMGSAGGQAPCVMHEKRTASGFLDRNGEKAHSIGYEKEKSPTITSSVTPSVLVEKKGVIPLRYEVARNKASNGLGVGKPGGPCPTLTTAELHSVFYEAHQFGRYKESDVAGTVLAGQGKTVSKIVVGRESRGKEEGIHRKPRSVKDILKKAAQRVTYIIRRLTPVECERLQGYPDNWTKYGADGTEIADTARYRAIGNSICVYCAERVYLGILDALEEEAENGGMG